ncbi:MAG: hypothetical protein M0T79_14430 [Actinomycetota bacterium]|nr:hypothetical protein [Actinomycetota bacterium]
MNCFNMYSPDEDVDTDDAGRLSRGATLRSGTKRRPAGPVGTEDAYGPYAGVTQIHSGVPVEDQASE